MGTLWIFVIGNENFEYCSHKKLRQFARPWFTSDRYVVVSESSVFCTYREFRPHALGQWFMKSPESTSIPKALNHLSYLWWMGLRTIFLMNANFRKLHLGPSLGSLEPIAMRWSVWIHYKSLVRFIPLCHFQDWLNLKECTLEGIADTILKCRFFILSWCSSQWANHWTTLSSLVSLRLSAPARVRRVVQCWEWMLRRDPLSPFHMLSRTIWPERQHL